MIPFHKQHGCFSLHFARQISFKLQLEAPCKFLKGFLPLACKTKRQRTYTETPWRGRDYSMQMDGTAEHHPALISGHSSWKEGRQFSQDCLQLAHDVALDTFIEPSVFGKQPATELLCSKVSFHLMPKVTTLWLYLFTSEKDIFRARSKQRGCGHPMT